jgi:hypothetical protein
VFLLCEVGPFSSALPVLVTHVIKFGHNTLGSKKVGLVFLPCEVGPFSSALPVLVIHVIKFGLNLLINPPGSLLTLNVWDVIFILASDRDIINSVRRGARTINQSIPQM